MDLIPLVVEVRVSPPQVAAFVFASAQELHSEGGERAVGLAVWTGAAILSPGQHRLLGGWELQSLALVG
jgi:hypothetical protein